MIINAKNQDSKSVTIEVSESETIGISNVLLEVESTSSRSLIYLEISQAISLRDALDRIINAQRME